jgi:glycosyltransferase involved in cell wall biosynthesis
MDSPESQATLQPAERDGGPIVAIIPAHDEDRFIASVVLKARRHLDAVLVIDDGSTDDTAWIAESCGALVIRQPANQGKAAALNAGLARARELDAQAAILIDGDGQQNPDDIPAVLGPVLRGEADIVIGSRFMGRASNTPGWRVAGQKALNWATNLASGVALTDTQSGFRALSRKAIGALNLRTSGFSAESEMQFIIRTHQLVVHEVPIVVNYDEGPKRNPIWHGFQVLNGILRLVGQHRPLFFFGVPGLIILVIGLLLGVQVVGTYRTYSALAVGTALVAITLILVGVFSIFTGLVLHTIRAYMTER